MKGGIIKNAYPLKIDKPRGYQLNSADNKKAIESKVSLYSFRSSNINSQQNKCYTIYSA